MTPYFQSMVRAYRIAVDFAEGERHTADHDTPGGRMPIGLVPAH
jgi:hypothetical protein